VLYYIDIKSLQVIVTVISTMMLRPSIRVHAATKYQDNEVNTKYNYTDQLDFVVVLILLHTLGVLLHCILDDGLSIETSVIVISC